MRPVRRFLTPLVLVPLALGACALPPAIVIGSYAADGVSYLATGKTVTDHGLSAATGHDCAVLRSIISSKPLCITATDRGKNIPVVEGKPSSPPSEIRVAKGS